MGWPDIMVAGLTGVVVLLCGLLTAIFFGSWRRHALTRAESSVTSSDLWTVLEPGGVRHLPSRQTLNDALLWYEGAAYLVVPVTGLYEPSRSPHIEALVTLCHILADHGVAVPVAPKNRRREWRQAVRALDGSSASWSFRERHHFFRLNQGAVSGLMEMLP